MFYTMNPLYIKIRRQSRQNAKLDTIQPDLDGFNGMVHCPVPVHLTGPTPPPDCPSLGG